MIHRFRTREGCHVETRFRYVVRDEDGVPRVYCIEEVEMWVHAPLALEPESRVAVNIA